MDDADDKICFKSYRNTTSNRQSSMSPPLYILRDTSKKEVYFEDTWNVQNGECPVHLLRCVLYIALVFTEVENPSSSDTVIRSSILIVIMAPDCRPLLQCHWDFVYEK